MNPINGGPPPIAVITIVLLADGNMQCKAECPNRFTLNAMLETAKQNLVGQMIENEKNAPKVSLPPAMAGINLRG